MFAILKSRLKSSVVLFKFFLPKKNTFKDLSLFSKYSALGFILVLIIMSFTIAPLFLDDESTEQVQKDPGEIEKNLTKNGKDHLENAKTLNKQAELYRQQGRYDEAEPLYKRFLEILEKSHGKDHSSVGGVLNNLAELYRQKGLGSNFGQYGSEKA